MTAHVHWTNHHNSSAVKCQLNLLTATDVIVHEVSNFGGLLTMLTWRCCKLVLDRVLRLRLRVLLVYICDQQTEHRLRALQLETTLEQNAITTLGSRTNQLRMLLKVLLPKDVSNPKTAEHRLRSNLNATRRNSATHRLGPTKLE